MRRRYGAESESKKINRLFYFSGEFGKVFYKADLEKFTDFTGKVENQTGSNT